MPLSYGGGVANFEMAKQILTIGFEKIVINTEAFRNPELITRISEHFGAQSVIGSIDVKRNMWGKYLVYVKDGKEKTGLDPVEWAQQLQFLGAGEILLTSIDRDGTWTGFDIELTRKVSEGVSIPVIANGGAGNTTHIKEVVKEGHASAVSIGSMVVYQKKDMGVLVNFPDRRQLEKMLE